MIEECGVDLSGSGWGPMAVLVNTAMNLHKIQGITCVGEELLISQK
jgi:hypothetical protein